MSGVRVEFFVAVTRSLVKTFGERGCEHIGEIRDLLEQIETLYTSSPLIEKPRKKRTKKA